MLPVPSTWLCTEPSSGRVSDRTDQKGSFEQLESLWLFIFRVHVIFFFFNNAPAKD